MQLTRSSPNPEPGATTWTVVGTEEGFDETICWSGRGFEQTSLCIVDSEGVSVREVKVSAEPEAIRCALEGYADRLDRVGVEASSHGICLYRELQPAGVPIIVGEARHMRTSLSTMRNKTDRNDARGIAQMMRLGW